jgi:hypothetical protein
MMRKRDFYRLTLLVGMFLLPFLAQAQTTTPPPDFTPIPPAEATQQVTPLFGCDPHHPTRFVIGQPAQVTPGLANNIRNQPGTNSQRVGSIPGGAIFKVIDGPRCNQGMVWWYVDYQGIVGWTAEGDADNAWLAPPFAAFSPITPDNAAQVTAAITTHKPLNNVLQSTLIDNYLLTRDIAGFSVYELFNPFDPTGEGWQLIKSVVGNFTAERFPIAHYTPDSDLIIIVRQPSQTDFYANNMSNRYTGFYSGFSGPFTINRDAIHFAYVAYDDYIAVHNIHPTTREGRRYSSSFHHALGQLDLMHYSPDGRLLILVSGTQIVARSDSGREVYYTLTALDATRIEQMVFSANSRSLAVIAQTETGKRSYVWGLGSQQWFSSEPPLRLTVEVDEGWRFDALALSPDGQVLALAESSGDVLSRLRLYHVMTGELLLDLDNGGKFIPLQLVFDSFGTVLIGFDPRNRGSNATVRLWGISN